jgi:thymidylate synthase (FAD)
VNRVDLYGDGKSFVELVDHMGSDLTIVNSARVSFGKHRDELDEKDEKLIKYLVKHKHTSTFEHNIVTFRIKVPLFVRSQHHRHRTWSYNEISRRYTDFNIEFYEPDNFRTQHESNRQASNSDNINPNISVMTGNCSISGGYHGPTSKVLELYHKDSLRLFDALLEAGVCREQARGVLPQNMYTEYYGTVNLNNLLKFISLRVHEGAQWEIQELAKGMLEIAEGLWPIAVKAFRKNGEKR